MNEVSTHQIAVCGRELLSLKSHILGQLGHWRALPNAIRHALDYAGRVAEFDKTAERERAVAVEIVRTLKPYVADEEVPLNRTTALKNATLQLLTLSRNLPEWENPGSLWNELHSTIQQHMEPAALGFDNVSDWIDRLSLDLRSIAGDGGRSADYLSDSLAQFRSVPPNPARVFRLVDGIDHALAALAKVEKVREFHRSLPVHTKKFRLAIVEDNKEWQDFVLRSVDRVQMQLTGSFQIEKQLFSNVNDAVSALVEGNREAPSRGEDAGNDSETQTIVIADIGLPRDSDEAEAIHEGKTTSSRRNGHELLNRLRSYRANIPVIVLTTPPYLLEDQLRACAQGIEDYHYILKGPDKEERLVEAILAIIHQAQSHRIDLWLSPEYEARIDGIPIPLTDMPFRTFYALSRLSAHTRKAGYTLEAILDQLDEIFRDDYDYKRPPETAVEHSMVIARQKSGRWWSAGALTQIANVIRLWAARKAECNGNISFALERLRKENFKVWKDGLSLLDSYRQANPNESPWAHLSGVPLQRFDPAVLASSFEVCFGGLHLEERTDYDLHNIEEHINLIRDGIHNAFKQAHRFIEPRTDILARRMVDDEYGYRVLGELILHDELSIEDHETHSINELEVDGEEQDSTIRALIVENDERYITRIESLLKNAGFDIRVATNEEDAILEARTFQPEVLSLDLHIPATPEEFKRDPTSGTAQGGLRALKSIRQDLPNIRVVIPTTLFDQDELRETASSLNVPTTDFVPKGETVNGAAWEGHLLLTVSRFRQELRTQAILPALPAWRYPVIRILKSSLLRLGRLNLMVNGREFRIKQSNQGRLLSILLQSPGDAVSYTEIDAYVTRQGKVNANVRKQWIKNVRDRIRSDWLGISDESPERPELEILETTGSGLILHAFVEFEEERTES